jgi:WD40 repeat protein
VLVDALEVDLEWRDEHTRLAARARVTAVSVIAVSMAIFAVIQRNQAIEQRLASASDDHTIRLWDIATQTQIGQLDGHTAR